MTRTRAGTKKETKPSKSQPQPEIKDDGSASGRRSLRSSGITVPKKEIVDASPSQINLNINTRSKAIAKPTNKFTTGKASLPSGKPNKAKISPGKVQASKQSNSNLDNIPLVAPSKNSNKMVKVPQKKSQSPLLPNKEAAQKISVAIEPNDEFIPLTAARKNIVPVTVSTKKQPSANNSRSSSRNKNQDIPLVQSESPRPSSKTKKLDVNKKISVESKKTASSRPTPNKISSEKKQVITKEPEKKKSIPSVSSKPTPIVKPSANDPLYNFGEYSEKLINWSILKKFDMQSVIESNMLGNNLPNNSGESTLTRATLDKLIKQALPSDQVRVHKDSNDLICHLANQFVELISDIANNCCYQKGKVLMFPEHMLCALQELNLDDYLLTMLSNDQEMLNPVEIKENASKSLDIDDLNLYKEDNSKAKMTVSVVKEEREKIVKSILRQLNDKMKARAKKQQKMPKAFLQNMDSGNAGDQVNLLQAAFEAEDADYPNGYDMDHSNIDMTPIDYSAMDANQYDAQANDQQREYEQQCFEYKQSWISYNQATLDQQYESWINEHMTYNQQRSAEAQATGQIDEGLITDPEIFKQTYGPTYFYDLQYNEFCNNQYYAQNAQPQPQPEEVPVYNEQQQQDGNYYDQSATPVDQAPVIDQQEEPVQTEEAVPEAEDAEQPNQPAIDKQKEFKKQREQQKNEMDFDDMEDND